MQDQSKSRFDPVPILSRLPKDRCDLFRGVVAWQEDVPGGELTVSETFKETPLRAVRRTVWDNPSQPNARIAVDVTECVSPSEAVIALMDRLEWNQLQDIPEGPENLGIASFVHPEGVSPAVFFVRDNLCISVVSFASEPAPVSAVASRLDQRLSRVPPTAEAAVQVELGEQTGGAFPVRVTLPYPIADNGYLRFSATGGVLEVRGDEVIALPAGPGGMRVDVYEIEPGRKGASGSLDIPSTEPPR